MVVPDDISVVGFDDTAPATTVWPELTTIRQPIAEMAEAAIEMLIGELRGDKRGNNGVTDRVLDYELIVRSSSGPAPQGVSNSAADKSRVIDKPASSR
jgi:LacI family transcriptional regulator